ncbi:rabaptin-5-associated exchange factor for Rab5 [Arctopsyche grandis]|uniref:rabaptin-5-associated exchange factor for Rab5 n=1 Tax=Arctopsyche grandis TaxID=121162 RepID=UPI00406D6D29
MYATKTPSYRIDQRDLKCKSGCGFYGNAQWQGYCSKCHREQVHRQRKAEKASFGASSTQREHQVLERLPKTSTPIAGFTKFEEKKLRQTDSQKKTKLLKLNVFRKASNAKDVGPPESFRDKSQAQGSISVRSLDYIKKDFVQKFPNLGAIIEKDVCKYVHVVFANISKQLQTKTIDELSDITQNLYQVFAKRMDESPNYAEVDGETKELLLDFVEKHSMTHLHSTVFSAYGSDDERKDARLHSRIRQLCWVSPQHLDCRIDQGNATARDLLYTAITELVAMDSVLPPGDKLAHVVGCCRGVVGVVSAAGGGPASADELLPALIFTVLKANPPRLISNINYVTRFCNAARLMTGEGGYYFTNLCCAVSFIENLTAESLNMTKDDYDAYMSLPAIVSGGSWVAALSLCEGLHDLHDQLKTLQDLENKTITFEQKVQDTDSEVQTFKNEILKKVSDILMRTPLEFTRRHINLEPISNVESELIEPQNVDILIPVKSEEIPTSILDEDVFGPCVEDKTTVLIVDNPSPQPPDQESDTKSGYSKHLIPPNSLANISMALDNPPMPTLRTIGSGDFLSPSPIFGLDSFDTQSLDELNTPDDYGAEQFAHGLTNVNYDIDLSDLSAENSAAEDLPPSVETRPKSQDPFSPDGLGQTSTVYNWQSIQPESLKPFESSHVHEPLLSILGNDESISILDTADSPTADCLLPSPIKPNTYQTLPDSSK